MKRKIAFALVMAAAVGAWSCLTLGQEASSPYRTGRDTVTRSANSSGGETVMITGSDFGPAVPALVQGHNMFEENIARLVGQLKSVEGAEKESVMTKLKSAVGEQFDQRQEGKARELKALEEQLAKLKEIQSKRTQQRDQIIADRVLQIVREVEGLGWGTDSPDFPRLRSTIFVRQDVYAARGFIWSRFGLPVNATRDCTGSYSLGMPVVADAASVGPNAGSIYYGSDAGSIRHGSDAGGIYSGSGAGSVFCDSDAGSVFCDSDAGSIRHGCRLAQTVEWDKLCTRFYFDAPFIPLCKLKSNSWAL